VGIGRPALSALLAGLALLGGCAYQGGIDNPLTQRQRTLSHHLQWALRGTAAQLRGDRP
jgi:hypothetical protein